MSSNVNGLNRSSNGFDVIKKDEENNAENSENKLIGLVQTRIKQEEVVHSSDSDNERLYSSNTSEETPSEVTHALSDDENPYSSNTSEETPSEVNGNLSDDENPYSISNSGGQTSEVNDLSDDEGSAIPTLPLAKVEEENKAPDSLSMSVRGRICKQILIEASGSDSENVIPEKKVDRDKSPLRQAFSVRGNSLFIHDKEKVLGQGQFKKTTEGLFYDYGTLKPIVRQKIRSDLPHGKKNSNDIRQEAERQKALDHPNIVKVYDFFQYKSQKTRNWQTHVYAEKCEGTLKGGLEKSKDLTFEERAKLACDIGSALVYLHGLGLAHNDIKPDNILVTGNGKTAKLADFGLTAEFGRPMASLCKKIQAPEHKTGPQVGTEKSDVYQFGLVLWHIFNPAPPIDRNWRSHLDDRYEYPCSMSWTPSSEKEAAALKIIESCLKTNPDERPTAADVLDRCRKLTAV